jgi:hypothetical protein
MIHWRARCQGGRQFRDLPDTPRNRELAGKHGPKEVNTETDLFGTLKSKRRQKCYHPHGHESTFNSDEDRFLW